MGFNRSRKLFRRLAAFIGLLIFAVALWTLYIELGRYPWSQIRSAVGQVPLADLIGAIALLFVSFLMTGIGEAFAARYGGRAIGPARAATAALISVGISNSASFGLFTGGALRYRLYDKWGFSAFETTKVLAFSTVSYWLGFSIVAGTGLLLLPPGVLPLVGAAGKAPGAVGVLLLALSAGYLLLSWLLRRGVRVRVLRFSPPSPAFAVGQILSAGIDWFAGASIIYLLLPAGEAGYGLFLAAFAASMLVGSLSQLPGGIGVFDSALIFLLSSAYPIPAITGALILYRLIYFLLPLLVGVLLLVSRELLYEKTRFRLAAERFGRGLSSVLPTAITLLVFFAGVILLFSGATPAVELRMRLLQSFLPLSVVEISHVVASAIGLGLLFLARGLQRRLRIAYTTTVVLLCSGVVASLLKGADYEEALFLLLALGAIAPLGRHFYREASFLTAPFSSRWIGAILLVLMATAWLTVFANRPVSLNRYLWLQTGYEADAARSLRALGGVIGVATVLFILRGVGGWLRSPGGRPGPESPIIRRIIDGSESTYPNLALLGDKRFLLNEEQDAFIMYVVSGSTWISMGDPVGPRERWPELVWLFQEAADREGCRVLFYEVGKAGLPLYAELGLAPLSLGQEARVDLATFTLAGRERHDLRHAKNKMQRDGWEVTVLPAGEADSVVPQLEEISRQWLEAKKSRERGFALGWFDPDYLTHFPIALVRREDEIIAFANLWESAGKEELSVDLMRHRPDAPSQTMDFLFVALIEYGRERGYRWFNLGLAPFTGMEEGDLAPFWHRLAGLLYRHGDHFYSFQGVRSYKEKFDPTWEPKYMVTPSGLSMPAALLGLLRVAARGPREHRRRRGAKQT